MKKHITYWNLLGMFLIIICLIWGYRWGLMGFILPYPLSICTAMKFKWD